MQCWSIAALGAQRADGEKGGEYVVRCEREYCERARRGCGGGGCSGHRCFVGG